MEQLHATYCERRLEGQREFYLLQDAIRIRGKTDSSEYEVTVDLKTVEPRFDVIAVQSKYHHWAVLVTMGCLLALFFVQDRPITSPVPLALFSAVGISLVFVILTLRKVEFASFKHVSGATAFDIARAGRDSIRFDAYVESIVRQIRISRGLE
jgi:hypothetical protein